MKFKVRFESELEISSADVNHSLGPNTSMCELMLNCIRVEFCFPPVVCNRALIIEVGFEILQKRRTSWCFPLLNWKTMTIVQSLSYGNKINYFEENNLCRLEDMVKLKGFSLVKTLFQCSIMKITLLTRKTGTNSEIVCGPLLFVYKFKETWIQNMQFYQCVHSIHVHYMYMVYLCFVNLKCILTLNV